ncbi:MAG: hypothetical protein ACXWEY_00645 [Bacteroidia bacterium]
MKYLLLLLLLFISPGAFAQTNPNYSNTKDTLVLYRYIGGKPSLKYVNAEKETAVKWGFKIEFFFGDCGGTYDYKGDEFNNLNSESYPKFVEKFGKNWAERFYIEVENLLKTEK